MRLLALILLITAGAAAQPVIDTNFAGAWRKVENNPRAVGSLPVPWGDNSGWAQTWSEYQQVEESGVPFLRARVTKVIDGNGQIQHNLPRITKAGYYKLRLRVRASAGMNVGMGVRRTGAPYTYLWQFGRFLPAAWQDITLYSQIQPAAYDIAFFILLNGTGDLDMSQIRLESMSEEQLREELSGSLTGYPKNLLRNTRFPLGLQSGWTLDSNASDGDEVRIEPDATALHLTTSKPTFLYSEPFPVGDKPMSASVYVRGTGSGRLSVIADGSTLQQKSYTAGADWQRIAVTFNPKLLARAHAFRLDWSGELWIEKPQVEVGGAASEFTAPGACEVALGVDSAARVQFEDEHARVRFAVTGADACAVLKTRIVNVYGQELENKPVSLESGREGEIAYAVWPERTFGAFRVEAWVENSTGERVSPYNELTVFRLRKPHYWGLDAPNSPFGVHTNPSHRQLVMAKAVGVNWARLHDSGLQYIGWYHLERKPGEWTFYDREIFRYRDHQIKIFGSFSTAPEWASYFDKARNGYFDRFYQPKDLSQFATYVRTVAKRYQGVIDAWDVWNEPWNAGWWGIRYDDAAGVYITSAAPGTDFARLQRTAYEAAKSVDPTLTIAGINSSTGSGGTKWSTEVVKAGGVDFCDVIDYHCYTGGYSTGLLADDLARDWCAALSPALVDGKSPKPTWMTEGSAVNGSQLLGPGFYRYTLPVQNTEDFAMTSDRTARYLVGQLAAGNSKIFLYSMHSHSHFSGAPTDWRVLVSQDGYLHPSAAAHSATAWLLEDTKFVKRVQAAPGVIAFLFQGDGYAVAAVLPDPAMRPMWPIPAGDGIEAFDVYSNPLAQGSLLGTSAVYLLGTWTDELEGALQK